MSIEFFVQGRAVPGGSKTYYPSKTPGKKGHMAPANKKTKPWMAIVAAYAREAHSDLLIIGPVKLIIEFRRLRPKGHYLKDGVSLSKAGREKPYPTPKPDLTKLVRSTEDALTGIIFKDDSQVVKQEMSKVYVDRDPGAMIRVETLLFEIS